MVLTAPSLGLGSCHGHLGVVGGIMEKGEGGGGGGGEDGGGEAYYESNQVFKSYGHFLVKNSESGVFIMIVPSL